MRTLHYALSGARYYKRDSIVIGLFTAIFLLSLTLLFDLRKSVELLFNQINQKLTYYGGDVASPFSRATLNHATSNYHYLAIVFCLLFFITFLLVLLFIFKDKQLELANWRLMGFSLRQTWAIQFLELLIPTLIAGFSVFSLLTIFDNYYESLLQTINYQVLQDLSSHDLANQTISTFTDSNFSFAFADNTNSLFVINFSQGFSLFTVLHSLATSTMILLLIFSIVVLLWQEISLKHLTQKMR